MNFPTYRQQGLLIAQDWPAAAACLFLARVRNGERSDATQPSCD